MTTAEHPFLARALQPQGAVARVCAELAGPADDADPSALLDAGAALLLRLLFLRMAAERGLLAGHEAALDPARAGWDGLRALWHAVACGAAAPGAYAAGGLFDDSARPQLGAARVSDRLLRALCAELAAGPALPTRLLGALHEEVSGRRLRADRGRLTLLAGGGGGRAAAGVYYTPEPIVAELLAAALAPAIAERGGGEAALGLRVCDPAMGSGHFLVGAARALGDAAGGGPSRRWRRLAAERCLWGADLSPAAADLARLSLWLECSEPGAPLRLPDGRLRSGESLLGVDWDAVQPGGFDAVIGNPPWGANLAADRERLRAAYRTGGEIESAALFVELALRICRPGGRVALITPNTWLTLVRQAGLRRAVLDAGRIELLSEHPPGTFPAVRSVVPLSFVVRRGPGADARPTLVRRAGAETCADQRAWRESDGHVIDLALTDAARAVLARIDARSEPLGAVCRVAYGIKTGGNARSLADAALDADHRPALAHGHEVRRHALRWAGRFLRYGPHLAGFRRSPVERPKLVVQYIRSLGLPQRLVAAVDEGGGLYPLNNFSYITAEGPHDLFFLCALLCSAPINAVFAGRFRDYNIKPAYLRRLPVRRIAFATPAPLRAALLAEALALPDADLPAFADARLAADPEQADVVHDILAALARRLAALNAAGAADHTVRGADALIDTLVARLYGLSAEDLAALGVA